MRALFLLVLSTGLMVGCTTSRYDRYGRSYPASARVDQRGGQDRYAVCHKGRNTLTLPQSAVRAHLNHGDRFGRCSSSRRRADRRDRRDDRRDDRYERRRDNDDRDDERGRRGRGRGNGRGHGHHGE